MVDIAAGIAALTASISLAKELLSIDKSLNEADFKLKIAELTSTLADAKISLVDARDEIDALTRQASDLRKRWDVRVDTVEVDGFRFEQKDGAPIGRPYCPRCDVVEHLLIRLGPSNSPGRPLRCPQCKQEFLHAPEYSYSGA